MGCGSILRAENSILRLALLTTWLCSFGSVFSEGNADEKDHSSSSLAVAEMTCGAG